MNRILLILSILTLSLSATAQFNTPIGARAAAMGKTSINQTDLWSAENNIGALPFYEKSAVGAYYSNEYLSNDLANKAIIGTYALKNSGIGLSLSQFGYSQYQENKIGIGYGLKLSDNFGVGAQLNYLNLRIGEGYGNKNTLSAKIGLYALINENFSVAATLNNPTRIGLTEESEDRLPTELQLGLNYEFSKKLRTSLQVNKDIDYDPSIHLGLEYQAIEILYLRAGIANKPSLSTFGFGLFLKDFQLDFASSFDSNLGFSPMISLAYTFD